MKLRIENGIIIDLDNNEKPVGVMAEGFSREEKRTIELGSELVPTVEKFIEDVNTGILKPRASVKEFETLINKYQ